MDRRETIKSLLIGSVVGVSVVTTGCNPDMESQVKLGETKPQYGRTPSELEYDQKLNDAPNFFSESELGMIATLCDIILPATDTAGSATDAKVPAFIEFIAKDLPMHQLPLQGGLMWLNGESMKRFEKPFLGLDNPQQIQIIDDIAYPDPDEKSPEFEPGRTFFNRMRNLTLTGYYTTKMGIDDLGYVGNSPNTWDGVDPEILAQHGLEVDEEWNAKCVDQSKRHIQAEWDENGNLLT